MKIIWIWWFDRSYCCFFRPSLWQFSQNSQNSWSNLVKILKTSGQIWDVNYPWPVSKNQIRNHPLNSFKVPGATPQGPCGGRAAGSDAGSIVGGDCPWGGRVVVNAGCYFLLWNYGFGPNPTDLPILCQGFLFPLYIAIASFDHVLAKLSPQYVKIQICVP